MNKVAAAAMLLVVLAISACGEAPVEQAPPASPPAIAYRIVDAVDESASCAPDEQLLSAYCFADPGRSISASGPALQAAEDGQLTVTCLTGGRNARLFCVKK